MSRATVVAGASALAAAACFGGQPLYGACVPPPDEVTLQSPCGFASVTTCSGAPAPCAGTTTCEVGPVAASCSIEATLGDGTEHTDLRRAPIRRELPAF